MRGTRCMGPGLRDPGAGPQGFDWSRLAGPQTDRSDTRALLESAGAVFGKPARGPSCFGGAVAVGLPEGESCTWPDFYTLAPGDHPNIEQAAELVGIWPEAYRQCQDLFSDFAPLWDNREVPASGAL